MNFCVRTLWSIGLPALCAALVLFGCADGGPAEQGDERGDSFVEVLDEDEERTTDVRALSVEQQGVLELVNTASFETLDQDVGLDVRAAQNIVDYRNGEDGQPGTDDDREIGSYEELDEIPWVGPYAFEQLREYAEEHGYIADVPPSEIHGIEIGSDDAEAVLDVANTASLGTLDNAVRLDVRAAQNIVDYRNGEDGQPGTDDDRVIDSLETLDGIAWVGPHAFGQLLEYAQDADDEIERVYGIRLGSVEADAILEVANESDFETLDDDVGLDVRAAENIIEYRKGDDGQLGTESDRTFDDLYELDEISYVGPHAFELLLDYAEDGDYVDEDPQAVHGILPDSTEGELILRLVNVASMETLDDSEAVGLDVRAAENIVAERDDDGIESLAALDDVSWVGPAGFERMNDYVMKHSCDSRDDCESAGLMCPVGSDRQCVPCTSSHHCDGNRVCDTYTNRCTVPDGCNDDADCGTGMECQWSICRTTCVDDSDCPTDQICNDFSELCGYDEIKPCYTDDECAAGYRCDVRGSQHCVECIDDADCPGSESCGGDNACY